MNSFSRYLSPYIGYALYFGLFVLIAGFFINHENSKYHTWIYLGLYFPALTGLLLNARTLAQDLKSDAVLQSFTALLLWMGITTLWSSHEDQLYLIKLLMMIWVLVLAVRLMLDDVRLLTITLNISLAVAATVVLYTIVHFLHVKGWDFYLWRLGQLGGRVVPEIVVGKICAVFMLYCLIQERLTTRPWARVSYGAMALIFFMPLILSFSRTAFLALPLTALWYYWQCGKTRLVWLIASMSLLLFIMMLLDIDSEWLSNISRSLTFEIRLWGWKATLQQIGDHWLLGYGLRAPFVVDWSDTPYADTGVAFWHAHNLFLAIWYETGLVGLSIALLFLALTVRKIRPLLHIREVRYWTCMFLFILLSSLVDSAMLIGRPAGDWLWFWLPLALAINIDKIADSGRPPTTGKIPAE